MLSSVWLQSEQKAGQSNIRIYNIRLNMTEFCVPKV